MGFGKRRLPYLRVFATSFERDDALTLTQEIAADIVP
jgi:hypothetical protein